MNYVNTANRPNPAAIFGALGVPGAFGLLLVVGLAVTVVAPDEITILEGRNIPDVPEPEIEPTIEPDPPEVTATTEPVQEIPQYLPPPSPDPVITFTGMGTTPIEGLPNLGSGIVEGIGTIDLGPITPPGPAFDPVAAIPRGNVGGWITDSDYRTSWINRDYSGVAGFALSIDARGRVTDCSITASTGHSALDQATCRLLERRARFNPAKDGNGNAVAGSFSSSVNWKIPE
jgi:protein TonB